MSTVNILSSFYNIIKTHHFGVIKLHSTNNYDIKIHARHTNFIISSTNHISQDELKRNQPN